MNKTRHPKYHSISEIVQTHSSTDYTHLRIVVKEEWPEDVDTMTTTGHRKNNVSQK